MIDISLMQYFLGLEVWQCSREFLLGMGKYVVEILMHGFVDFNWARDASDRKSTSGCFYSLT